MNAKLAFTIPEFVEASGVGRSSVYEAIAAGRLKARKNGARTLIAYDDGRDFIDALPVIEPDPEGAK